MCDKTQFKYCPSTIDKCMRPLIQYFNKIGVKTLSCCCGHGKYPMTIVVEGRIEVLSGIVIPRKTRFYVKDGEGYYYIPEIYK